jgi:hypothetical protein
LLRFRGRKIQACPGKNLSKDMRWRNERFETILAELTDKAGFGSGTSCLLSAAIGLSARDALSHAV